MSGIKYKSEPGRVRLPAEAVAQWESEYSGPMRVEDFYLVLWWLADHGYSIVPDEIADEYRAMKEGA